MRLSCTRWRSVTYLLSGRLHGALASPYARRAIPRSARALSLSTTLFLKAWRLPPPLFSRVAMTLFPGTEECHSRLEIVILFIFHALFPAILTSKLGA